MRKIVLYVAMSLDGYLASENGELDWLDKYNDTQVMEEMEKITQRIDTVIMGKKTFKQLVEEISPDAWPYVGKKCLLLTHDLSFRDEKVEVLHELSKAYMDALKAMDGDDIFLVGGGETIGSFLEQDLIDEYIITVVPEILGRGIPLFQEKGTSRELKMENVSRMGDLVTVTYTRK